MNNLFTYGTLLYEDEEPSFNIDINRYIEEVKRGVVQGDLYVVEGFPFLNLEGDGTVKGKLFVLKNIENILTKYDKIEGSDDPNPFFERKVVNVKLEDGSEEKAYCYVGGNRLIECFGKPEYRMDECNWDKIRDRWE